MFDDDDIEAETRWCPHCGDERPVDDDGICCRCGNDVDDDPLEVGDDTGERWCEGCGDYRPFDDDGCCARCGEEIGS